MFIECYLLYPTLIGGALSDAFVWRLSVAYIGRNSRTERPRKTKIATDVAHVTRDSDTTFKVKGQGHQAALVGCTGRPTWTYSNGDLSICVHDVYRVTTFVSEMTYTVSSGTLNSTIPYRVTTCRPGRERIVAAAGLQLVMFVLLYE